MSGLDDAARAAQNGLDAAPTGVAWVVVHARPRSEKKLAEFCRQRAWPNYLPMQTRTHRYGGRLRSFQVPLFPGYLFCATDAAGCATLRQNRHAARVLEVPDQIRLIEQLDGVRRALATGSLVEVLPYLQPGRTVRIRSGPLKGLEGVVVRGKGATRLIVNVEMIRHAVAMEVDGESLEPA